MPGKLMSKDQKLKEQEKLFEKGKKRKAKNRFVKKKYDFKINHSDSCLITLPFALILQKICIFNIYFRVLKLAKNDWFHQGQKTVYQ
jgi:hypothetical protein